MSWLTPSVNVVISGPETLMVDQEADYNVTISGELTHTDPKKPVNKNVQFQFKYKAPLLPGNQTMYTSGNSVDLNDKKTGDMWNYAPDKLIVVGISK